MANIEAAEAPVQAEPAQPAPAKPEAKKKSDMSLSSVRKAWALLERREKRQSLAVLFLLTLGAFSEALMVGSVIPFLAVLTNPDRITETPALNWAYETFGFTSDFGFLVAMGLGSLAVIVFANALLLIRTYVVEHFARMRGRRLGQRLLSVYMSQPYAFFLDRHTGDMTKQVLAEAREVVDQFYVPGANLIASTLASSAIIALLIWVEPVVALVSMLALGLVYGTTYAFSQALVQRLGEVRVNAFSEMYRVVGEGLGGIKDIKILGRERVFRDRFDKPSYTFTRTHILVRVIEESPRYIVQAAVFGGVIILCLVQIDSETLGSADGLGELVPLLGVFAFAGQRLIPALQQVYRGFTKVRFGTASVNAVYADLIGLEPADKLPKTPPAPLGLTQTLELQDVSYSYPKAEHAGLRDLSVTINAGERIGIVGGTGAGKTTFADLVLGLLWPDQGQLCVDGVPITPENRRAWMQSVGYVPQDVFLVDASISANIALGLDPKSIDPAEVERAARLAQVHDFIVNDLPNGYDTEVGERGVRLSGGQKQRIGIARALFRNADLIVFDEATSALDVVTERDVRAAIDDLPGEKTILMIAHRLSTVRTCDRILVFDKGRIVGFAPWDALIESNPTFKSLVQLTEA